MILVVDDDEDVRATIRQLLDVLAYESAEAEDGPTALASIEERRPDVVILDYSMPGMNGDEVATLIWQQHEGLPLIFASGYADEPSLRKIVGGTAPILNKPFRVCELASLIDQALAVSTVR
jgi:CheY-like chemotaxis protein